VKRRTGILLGILGGVLFGFVFVVSSRSKLPPLPSPNGYDDLVSVVPRVAQHQTGWRTQDTSGLRALVDLNSNAVAVIRAAFSKQWAVPVSPESNYMSSMAPNLIAIRTLANSFCAEGRLAQVERRTNDALSAFMDSIQLGHKSSQGGLIIHDMVGVACKTIGAEGVRQCIGTASDEALRAVFVRLADVDRTQEPAEEVIARDRDWARSAGWLQFTWNSVISRSLLRRIWNSLRATHLRSEAELRLLRSDVALELFRRRRGVYPASMAELVPEFFEDVPSDPFSSAPMIYRRATNSYLLYSIGPNEKDDGGAPPAKKSGSGSLYNMPDVPLQGDLISTPPR
jgi:hypothetical protein